MIKMNNKNQKWKHPELKEGEMFLCNSAIRDFGGIGWKTKRMGIQAFDIYRNKIKYIFPIFVQKKEYDEGMKQYEEND